MEAEIIRKVDDIVENSKSKHEKLKTVYMEITGELDCSKSLLNKLREEKRHNNLFIEMKNAENRLPILTNKERQLSETKGINDRIEYTRKSSLMNRLNIDNPFGHLGTERAKSVDIQNTYTIKIKSESDTKECDITCLVFIELSKMIAIDSNKKVSNYLT